MSAPQGGSRSAVLVAKPDRGVCTPVHACARREMDCFAALAMTAEAEAPERRRWSGGGAGGGETSRLPPSLRGALATKQSMLVPGESSEASLSRAPYRDLGGRAEVDRLQEFRRFAAGKPRRQAVRGTLHDHVSINGHLAHREVVDVAVR